MSLNIGDSIPEFSLVNYDKEKYESKDSLGRKTMFVFMPSLLAVYVMERFVNFVIIWILLNLQKLTQL